MTPEPSSTNGTASPSIKWSVLAGGYAVACSTLILLVLGPLVGTLLKILGFPAEYPAFVLAGPVSIIGSIMWWLVVESRASYTYLHGGAVGLATALFTILLWTLTVGVLWGPSLILVAGLLVGFVLVVTLPVAFIGGLPLMYLRVSLDDDRSDRVPFVG